MNDTRAAREEDLRFFGRITASVTHELNNVFSVVGENSGLLSDRVKRVKDPKELDLERVRRICSTIQKHLERGQKIIKRLNTFAHGVDAEETDLDLAEALENIVELTNRFAYRKRIELELALPKKPKNAVTSQFLFQQAVFNAIMFALEDSDAIEKITVELSAEKGRSVVTVTGAAWEYGARSNGSMEVVSRVCEEMGAGFETDPAKGSLVLSVADGK